MGGGKKNVYTKRTTNFYKHAKIQNRPVKTKSPASFTNTNTKQTITDAKATVVMHRINARWRAKGHQEKSYPGENVT